MDENSVEKPLLFRRAADSVKKTHLFVLWANFEKWTQLSSGSVFGITGTIFMVYSGPVFVIAYLSIACLIISRDRELHERKASTKPRFRLWTFPLLV
ncbi:hypothetical protein CMV_020698 [Castanea mollissima]|uniref:Uncharacterized protein n=1 Tax=Castanea mollissima TaxID=60419 RepID=A0A8J4VFK3_9ROSI|nr:hypothetical protein CMV_020698 [Castanea mollissima]